MGACGSSMTDAEKEEKIQNKRIERKNKEDLASERSKIKLLLLGAGESGKSTIFKQMKILYGANNGYSTEERIHSKTVVFGNIISNMKTVLKNCEVHTQVTDANSELAKSFMSLPEGDEANIDVEVGGYIKNLWNDTGVQSTWQERSNYQVQDALKYYCAEIGRISAEDYIPNDQDILRARVRTSGIVEEKYNLDGVLFEMYDVGGQRNERKKWIHCFDAVTAVIFVAAINEYNQVLYEDNDTNRMEEAIELFDEICNSTYFKNTSMILFLNKNDLFREKLVEFPLRIDNGPDERYTDFQGPFVVSGTASAQIGTPEFETAYVAGSEYLLKKFTDRNKVAKKIYHHITCATDTNNVKVVFNACKDIILQRNLEISGFMEVGNNYDDK